MNGKDVDQFIKLAAWTRKEISGVQFYATLESLASLRSLPFLDIAQIINIDDRLKDLALYKTEIWLYDAKGPAKNLSPYSYYRLMSWKAFVLGLKGAGFWNYSDFSGWGDLPPVKAWDDFVDKGDSYAVIYEGSNGHIVSSRRWESWRMGVEDYELLTMYAKAKGIEKAKALAKSVLDNTSCVTKADQVRLKILEELSP